MLRRRHLLTAAGGALGVAAVGAAAARRWQVDDEPAAEADEGDEEIEDPRSGHQQIIWNVQTDTPHAALSFDDGPNPDLTPRILDILDDLQVTATFMAMGHSAEQHPDLVTRMVGAGHEIGHHTWQHKNLATIDNAEARAQMDNGVRLVEEATGTPVRWFRPPRGRLSEAAIRLAAKNDHDIVLWSVTRGALAERSPRRVADHVIGATGPGDIIDLHDGIGRGTFDPDSELAAELTERRQTEIEALPSIIRGLRSRGVEPTTIGNVVARAEEGQA